MSKKGAWNNWEYPQLIEWVASDPNTERQTMPSTSCEPRKTYYPHMFCHPRLGYCGLVICRPFYGFCEPGTCSPGYVFCNPFMNHL